jgi:hydroxyethylthiazole kinase-like uncharacterized protein yjeF
MKVISSTEMGRIERLAIEQGASESAFMVQAGEGLAAAISAYMEEHRLEKRILLLCGRGNNGGDAYVAGAALMRSGYSVTAYQAEPDKPCSPLCQEQRDKFAKIGKTLSGNIPSFTDFGLIVDGLFGTGFHGALAEPYVSLVSAANSSGKPIIAVDIPSGLNGETGAMEGVVVKAVMTVYMQLPKTGFFLQDGWNVVGKLIKADFGLPQKFIEEAKGELNMLTEAEAQKLLPPIVRKQHKYQRGYVVGLAGSPGMPGAALLSAESSLRGGAGIFRLMHPQGMEEELSAAPYEVIREAYDPKVGVEQILKAMSRASSVYIGPGIGRSDDTRRLLRQLLASLDKPAVLDGDALTLIAEEEIPLPPGAILTPHEGELMRLLKLTTAPKVDRALLTRCQEFAEHNQVTLVLKGGPTFIFHPGMGIGVNSSGDPGMATAGSGDVLTGLMAAMLAHGLTPDKAATLAVYLHGVAGEYAAKEKTSYCVIASDITHHLPNAFERLRS